MTADDDCVLATVPGIASQRIDCNHASTGQQTRANDQQQRSTP